jgi:ketosteroid isomerase-like protein
MSANLDLVHSIYTAWGRGDFSSSDWAHPEIEVAFADGPSPGNWRGLAGFREAWRDFLGTWEQASVQADEYREIDDQHVLVLAHFRGRGKTSGLELEQVPAGPACMLWEFRQGKVIRQVFYWDREHALAAVGLASEPGCPKS